MSALLDFLFPAKCVVCDRAPQLICAGCLPVAMPSYELLDGHPAHYVIALEGPSEKLISGFKDHMKLALSGHLARYLDIALKALRADANFFVFPPSTRGNYARRGYNPVETICEKSLLLKPLVKLRVRTLKQTRDQRQLSAAARRENLDGAYEIDPGQGRVLIIDDVLTTGATVLALAKALQDAGFEVAGICAIARRNPKCQTRPMKKA